MAQHPTLFTPQQKLILDQFRHTRGSPIPLARLVAAVYGDREDGGPLWADSSVRVQLYRLRSKLVRHGVAILTIGMGGPRGSGYMIDPEHLDRLEEVLAGGAAVEIALARGDLARRLGPKWIVDSFAHLLCADCYAAIQQARESASPAAAPTPAE